MNRIPLLHFLVLAAIVAVAPKLTRAACYIEPRLSLFTTGGTPGVGDIGRAAGDDFPRAAATLILGREMSPRFCAELRVTAFDGFTVAKRAPHWPITPGASSDVILPVVVDYDYEQRTTLATLALPVRLAGFDRFTLSAVPLLHFEHSRITLTQLVNIAANSANLVRTTLRRETVDSLRGGAELALACRLNARTLLRLNYSFHDLRHADLHEFGVGAVCAF